MPSFSVLTKTICYFHGGGLTWFLKINAITPPSNSISKHTPRMYINCKTISKSYVVFQHPSYLNLELSNFLNSCRWDRDSATHMPNTITIQTQPCALVWACLKCTERRCCHSSRGAVGRKTGLILSRPKGSLHPLHLCGMLTCPVLESSGAKRSPHRLLSHPFFSWENLFVSLGRNFLP